MTTTKNATLTVNLIETNWELDTDTTLMDQEPEMLILRQPCSYDRYMTNEVDPEATIAALIEIGGCTEEQARQQAANLIHRFIQWQTGSYTFLGCTATAYAVLTDEHEDEIGKIEVASTSVWGVEQDCGDYGPEVEKEQISELLDYVQQAGYDLTAEEWAAIPREEAKDSYSTYPLITTNTTPLPALDAHEGYTSRYIYDGQTVIVSTTCDECDALLGNAHESWCDAEEGGEDQDALAEEFLITKSYGL